MLHSAASSADYDQPLLGDAAARGGSTEQGVDPRSAHLVREMHLKNTSDWFVPPQRTATEDECVESTPSADGDNGDHGSRATAVLPYIASPVARRTRPLRAWMMVLPMDLAAFLSSLTWKQQNWKGVIVTAVLMVILFAVGRLYQGRRHLSVLDDLPSLCGRMLISIALVGIIVAERHDAFEYLVDFLRVAAVSAVAVIAGRTLTYKGVNFARQKRWVEHSAIVIGGGPAAVEIARLLRRYPQYGLRFVGFIDVESTTHTSRESMPLIGRLDDIEQMVKLLDCDVIIIADIECPETELLQMAVSPAISKCDLWVVPRLRDVHSHGGISDHIGAVPVVHVSRPTLTGPKWAIKRASDVVFSLIALVLLSPVFLLCAIATFIEGGRGIFFYQQRIGRYGQPFNLVKFRSLRPCNDAESQTKWSVAHDSRVGVVGRFMRRTSLDELPQLWNILRGDMTVVGPRPERPFFVDQFSADYPGYAMRHRVPVGLTGLAQVSGLRGDTPISDRARFDNYYIQNWSIWLDVKVLVRTVGEVFRGGGR